MKLSRTVFWTVAIAVSGCSSAPIDQPIGQPTSIGYLDGKYRVCRDDCPTPTPKEFDDSIPLEQIIMEKLAKAPDENRMPPPMPVQAAEQPTEQPSSQYEIYFDFGASTPNKTGEQELLHFIDHYHTSQSANIRLIGSTDPIGTKAFNHRLAQRRAQFVEAWLEAHNVKAQIEISTQEECCLQAPYDKGDLAHAQKRKVTIIQE